MAHRPPVKVKGRKGVLAAARRPPELDLRGLLDKAGVLGWLSPAKKRRP